MTREKNLLTDAELSEPVDLDLSANTLYTTIKALLHCNGTLNDIKEWWYGRDDPRITQLVTQFYIADSLYATHKADMLAVVQKSKSDAAAKAAKSKSKSG